MNRRELSRRTSVLVLMLGVGLLTAVTVYAASKKKPGVECKDDDECKGHCYKKGNGKEVCVDCSSSTIGNARGRIKRYCKEELRSCKRLGSETEVSQEIFEDRIESGDNCIKAREAENKDCWGGGDRGHKQAVDEAGAARKTCYDEWNTRKSTGFLFTCSQSTYSSKSRDVDRYCSAYGKGCASWRKDDKKADCDDIEDALEDTDKCVDAVESLDSSCLPRPSRPRKRQFEAAQNALDYCKEVLRYKKDKKLCE